MPKIVSLTGQTQYPDYSAGNQWKWGTDKQRISSLHSRRKTWQKIADAAWSSWIVFFQMRKGTIDLTIPNQNLGLFPANCEYTYLRWHQVQGVLYFGKSGNKIFQVVVDAEVVLGVLTEACPRHRRSRCCGHGKVGVRCQRGGTLWCSTMATKDKPGNIYLLHLFHAAIRIGGDFQYPPQLEDILWPCCLYVRVFLEDTCQESCSPSGTDISQALGQVNKKVGEHTITQVCVYSLMLQYIQLLSTKNITAPRSLMNH